MYGVISTMFTVSALTMALRLSICNQVNIKLYDLSWKDKFERMCMNTLG